MKTVTQEQLEAERVRLLAEEAKTAATDRKALLVKFLVDARQDVADGNKIAAMKRITLALKMLDGRG